ncbi:MAG: Hsp33 family molecular chaperone HslO [Mariprofundaceae bacterium]|nr:Hsp33 family molecular chaperone HslO [Mariprofundaceae bacterium]
MAENTDTLIRFLLPEAHTRGAIIRGTNIVEKAIAIHGLSGIPAEMMSKTLLASIVLLSVSKGGIRQVLQLDSHPSQPHAPIRRILAEARPGHVRGYLNWQENHAGHRNKQETGISAWMGRPLHISTVRDMGFGTPYVSTIEHDSEYLADHILHYLNQSVQVQADIILTPNLALFIEAMPGCQESSWFEAVKAMAAISDDALQNDKPETVLHAFDDLKCKIVGHDGYSYECGCSIEKMANALTGFAHDELQDLVDDQGNVTVSCQYCSNHYSISLSDIQIDP